MQKFTLFLVVFLALVPVYAGTVTLTGTCTQQSQGLINFSLFNSGNDSALLVSVTPHVHAVNSSVYTTNSIGPGQMFSFVVQTAQHNNGSYVYYFSVRYSQTGSVFYAVFPCSTVFGNGTVGSVAMNYSLSYYNTNYTIYVYVHNYENFGIADNISLILPQDFNYITQPFYTVEIPAGGNGTAVLKVRSNATGSYSGAIVSNYLANGTDHASLLNIILTPQSTQQAKSFISLNSLFELFAVLVIALLILLIARAFAKKGPGWMRKHVKESN